MEAQLVGGKMKWTASDMELHVSFYNRGRNGS